MNLNSTAQDVVSCELCLAPKVQLLCESCHAYLYESCVGDHSFSGEFKDHKCSSPTSLRPSFCKSRNNERCEMFCNVCQTPVCLRSLASVEHIGHTSTILSKVVEWNIGSRSRDSWINLSMHCV